MKKIVTIVTLCAFLFSGCASFMPEIQKQKLTNDAAASKQAHDERMARLAVAQELAKKPTTPDSAVFAQIGKTDKVTNEHDASIARSQAVASTVGAVIWPLAMVAGLKSIFGALAGLGRNEINATNSDVVVGRDGSNNQGTGGDIRVGSPNSTSTTTDTRTDTRTDTSSSNSQSNSSGDNN